MIAGSSAASPTSLASLRFSRGTGRPFSCIDGTPLELDPDPAA
jgi:hypothetical protein